MADFRSQNRRSGRNAYAKQRATPGAPVAKQGAAFSLGQRYAFLRSGAQFYTRCGARLDPSVLCEVPVAGTALA